MKIKLMIALLMLGNHVIASDETGPLADPDSFSVPSPFDSPPKEPECPFERQGDLADLAPVIELMKEGSDQAVACVKFLNERFPEWERIESAQSLVGPFVSYLLDSGADRGMQRHEIILDLLGPLQTIAPDWRLRDEIDERLADILLGSVVEDPFVANFWRETVEESDLQWQDSDAASSVIPELYRLAFEQAQRPPDRRNERPKSLLRELSWLQHARLVLATRVFDTWPKRILWMSFALVILVLSFRFIRRRKNP